MSDYRIEKKEGEENRWTDDPVIWAYYTEKHPRCSECLRNMKPEEIAYFCTVRCSVFHKECRDEHDPKVKPRMTHKDKRVVVISEKARQKRFEELKEKHKDDIQEFKQRKIRKKVLHATR